MENKRLWINRPYNFWPGPVGIWLMDWLGSSKLNLLTSDTNLSDEPNTLLVEAAFGTKTLTTDSQDDVFSKRFDLTHWLKLALH